ncbi:hypothetical protein [Thalassolituus oleivorans]|nr:hypothetical protein [Thalassolituus oleivorans]
MKHSLERRLANIFLDLIVVSRQGLAVNGVAWGKVFIISGSS